MGIRTVTYLASTRIVARGAGGGPALHRGGADVLPGRFGTTVVYGQSRGVYEPLLDVPATGRP